MGDALSRLEHGDNARVAFRWELGRDEFGDMLDRDWLRHRCCFLC